MPKHRTYKVWVKGFKLSTSTTRQAETAELAAIRYGLERGVKSFQVEAVWQRGPEQGVTG